MANLNLDVVIVGAGFSGCLSLHEFRKRGFNAKIIEAGDDLGGVWYWNHYPGVQVDSLTPLYQFTDPELWEDFSFTKLYPSGDEVLRYFEHLDSKLELRKDIVFGHRVTSAQYIDRQWQLQTDKGLEVTAPMVVWAVGTTNKQLFPQWKGLSSFKGQVIHAARWPKDFDPKGKRIGLVGQGSTGVQIVERLSKEDCQVTVFVRTPPIALPARQKTYSEEDIREAKATYPKQFHDIQTTHMPYAPRHVSYHDETPEARQALWEAGWKEGGLAFGSCNYYDIVLDQEANRGIYDFWVRKVRQRMKDPAKRDIVAPLVPVSYFGVKRSCLEHDYYESLDRPNVKVVSLLETPVAQVAETGLETDNGQLHELDILVLATGYDSVTGSLLDADIRDKDGITLQAKWKNGIRTQLGMLVPGMPNAFILYGPQAPTALANGPTFIELQVVWIMRLIDKMVHDKVRSVEPKSEYADEWNAKNVDHYQRTLMSQAKSWWNGANVPGKKTEPLLWFGGQAEWWKESNDALEDWSRWNIRRQNAPSL